MKALLVKMGNFWLPADEAAEEVTAKFPQGFEYVADIKKNRNGKFHRLAMKQLQIMFDVQNTYDDFDVFRKAMTIAAGYFKIIQLLDGKTMLEAESLSYESMDDLAFRQWREKVIQAFIDRFFSDLDEPTKNLIVRF